MRGVPGSRISLRSSLEASKVVNMCLVGCTDGREWQSADDDGDGYVETDTGQST